VAESSGGGGVFIRACYPLPARAGTARARAPVIPAAQSGPALQCFRQERTP